MKKTLIMLIATLLFFSCTDGDTIYKEDKYACTESISNTNPRANEFQTFIETKVSQGIPGMTMLIKTSDGIWTGAAGKVDIASNIDMKPCNIMRVGSITKIFTATLIMQLQEEGKLTIDDPISDYLSNDIVSNVKNTSTATIKNLLNHTSGIVDYTKTINYILQLTNDPAHNWTMQEELEFTYNKKAEFIAGTKRNYSNTNFLLLGLIAENITNKTGTQLYKERIFDILNLSSTDYNQDGTIPSDIARGYADDEGNFTIHDATNFTLGHNTMDGGITSNIFDLYKFITAVNTPNILLTQNSITSMRTVVDVPRLNPRPTNHKATLTGVGLGWFIMETNYGNAVAHGGRTPGYSSFMYRFLEQDITVIYMINGSDGEISKIEQNIFQNELVTLLFE